ncbi:MAG TPA: nuclease-related domain-containing protein [Rhodocyclaceae bacterium]|uniref:nuclease-related domain-containing protein n=1 Tax=Accumulibacter sp. TaxID=2053492 RepID=UPI002B897551|nr:nuclease-related domain-containing protein [Accumulibacter sp.]HNB79897.1 nuclease-related domain-containing protein [Rhodocyclaceae bacterium]HNC21971.1 nuclease-related domain-containing protein [Accumulibacter sp.]HNH14714.1 nuclease-related domain-containing protein [Rhodocyclaceae bacterium]HNI00474.1 nuclease-related domain-containing protein [Rhodocyclaceae bacterium]
MIQVHGCRLNRTRIEQEVRQVRAGIKAEEESAYLIDFALKDSRNTMVIHDLRLEIGGRVAQIDHLLLHRTLTAFVLETKAFHAGLKITEEGEFLRWNAYRKTFEGMPSPIAQNERHVQVLKDAFGCIDMPTRLGLRLTPTFEPYVLIAPHARIDRPKKLDSGRVIKADQLMDAIDRKFEKESLFETVGSLARFVSSETIQQIAEHLISLHRPIRINYEAMFVDRTTEAVAPAAPMSPAAPAERLAIPVPQAALAPATTAPIPCKVCGSTSGLQIAYGKYGYYFKCGCGGNTAIRPHCVVEGHKPRLRKDGTRFYLECADCGMSTLYFQNAV